MQYLKFIPQERGVMLVYMSPTSAKAIRWTIAHASLIECVTDLIPAISWKKLSGVVLEYSAHAGFSTLRQAYLTAAMIALSIHKPCIMVADGTHDTYILRALKKAKPLTWATLHSATLKYSKEPNITKKKG